jgi:hypothetical protein
MTTTQLALSAKLIAKLQSEGLRRVEVDDSPQDEVLSQVIASLTGKAGTDVVTYLPFGQTARSDGYGSESQYLASQRRPQPMRLRKVNDRNSHRRWLSEVTTVSEILENKDRSWRGNAACRRQAAKAYAATAWYGVPNLILGA